MILRTLAGDEANSLIIVDYKTFLTILNRPDGFKPAGTAGKSYDQ